MNRRGQGTYVGESWADLILVPIFIVLIAAIMLLSAYVYHVIKEETTIFSEEGKTQVSAEAISDISGSMDTINSMYPFLFVMIIASMLTLMAVSAYLIESNIVFLVPGIIILSIAILITVPLANFYEEFTLEPEFATEVSEQSLIVTLMSKMPIIIFIIGATFLLIMYSKKGKGGIY